MIPGGGFGPGSVPVIPILPRPTPGLITIMVLRMAAATITAEATAAATTAGEIPGAAVLTGVAADAMAAAVTAVAAATEPSPAHRLPAPLTPRYR